MNEFLYARNPLALAVHKVIVGTGAVLAFTASGFSTAGDVRNFGEINLSNNADPAFVEIEGVKSLSFRIPAGETKVSLSGYVKGDLSFDDSSDLGDSFAASGIPVDGSAGDEEDGHTRLHARQSRFRIRSETVGAEKTLKTHFEADFFGGGGNESLSNSASLRLRHAYASYGRWTIGQTWTNFMDFVAYPTTVDFFGPAGKSFIRQGQIRYTLDNGLSFSVENPETDGRGSLGDLRESTGGVGQDLLPDFTAAWRGGPGGSGGSYEIAGVVRFLGVDGDLGGTRIDEDETGFGFNAAGGWSFGNLDVSASITGGDGIGRYIINGVGNDLFITDTGQVETVESISGTVNLKYNWTSTSSSLISVGAFTNDTPEQSNGIDNIQTIHLNYLWTPYPASSFGVEVIQGFVENADGSEGDATRLAFGAQLNF